MFGIGSLVKLLSGGFVERILDRVIGNKSDRDSALAKEQSALLRQYASEFRHIAGRTWADAFVDVVNRLPRPMFALSVIALLAYAPIDPPHFAAIMQAYALVPEWLAMVMAAVITFFFGGRVMDKWNGRMKAPTVKDVTDVMDSMDRLKKLSKKYESDADDDVEAQYINEDKKAG